MMLAAVVLVAIAGTEAALFAATLRTRRRAESLVASLRRLRVGTSTFQDVQPLLIAYGAAKLTHSNCAGGDDGYGIQVMNSTINRLGLSHPMLLNLGVRPWGATAALSFKAGHLCEYRFDLGMLAGGSEYPIEARVSPVPLVGLDAATTMREPNGDGNYHIRALQSPLREYKEGGVRFGLEFDLTPNATQTELQHALTFDLSCFTSFRGCRRFSQVMPLALQDVIHDYETKGLPLPEEFEKENPESLPP
jgi:hypothetical protein